MIILVERYWAAVPSGASTGKYEAVELRDHDDRHFLGKGVLKAIQSVNEIISKSLKGRCLGCQTEIDDVLIRLDGTENKGVLGANAILSVSLAYARASADALGMPLYRYINGLLKTKATLRLPTPYFNVLNGGSHAGNYLSFQEFMIVPKDCQSFDESMKIGAEVYQHLKLELKQRFGLSSINVGDEGGFAPQITSPEEALELISTSIHKAGYENRVSIALDVAASGMGVCIFNLL